MPSPHLAPHSARQSHRGPATAALAGLHWRALVCGLACGAALLASGLTAWQRNQQVRAEAELHGTWLPLVTAVGDLKSDLDAWQEDPVPLMAERVEARLAQIRQLGARGSDLGGPTATHQLLSEAQWRWQALRSGQSSDWDGLHACLRELGLTGLAHSERLAELASGLDA